MNKYLAKLAASEGCKPFLKLAELSEENKHVAKTALELGAVSLASGAAGSAVGAGLARRFAAGKMLRGVTSENAGQFIGGHIAGGLADLAVLKHNAKGPKNGNTR